MKLVKSQGFIFKITNFKDNDKLVHILTPEKGKILVTAKGVRSIKSRRAGHIDLCNINTLSLHKGSKFFYLTGTQNIYSFRNLKESCTYYLFYICELIDKSPIEPEDSRLLFRLLSEILVLANKSNIEKLIAFFEINLLTKLGFKPELETYAGSNTPLSKDRPIFLSQSILGFTRQGNTIVNPSVIKCQRFFLANTTKRVLSLNIPENIQASITSIQKSWLQEQFDTKFRSLEFL